MAGKLGGLSPRTQLEALLWQRDQTYDEVVAEFDEASRHARRACHAYLPSPEATRLR